MSFDSSHPLHPLHTEVSLDELVAVRLGWRRFQEGDPHDIDCDEHDRCQWVRPDGTHTYAVGSGLPRFSMITPWSWSFDAIVQDVFPCALQGGWTPCVWQPNQINILDKDGIKIPQLGNWWSAFHRLPDSTKGITSKRVVAFDRNLCQSVLSAFLKTFEDEEDTKC